MRRQCAICGNWFDTNDPTQGVCDDCLMVFELAEYFTDYGEPDAINGIEMMEMQSIEI